MYRENDYLRKLLQKQKEQHQTDMKHLKLQYEKLKEQKDNITVLYHELQQALNESRDPEEF